MTELAEVGRGLLFRARYLRRMARRATALPTATRALVWLLALAAMAVAYPTSALLGPGLALLVLVAAGAAVWPGGRWPTVAIVVAVVGWLASTTAYAQPVATPRLLALAGLLYLLHATAALAAHMPYDAVVSARALVRGLARAVLVVLAGTLVGVALLLVPGYLGQRAYLLAAVLGLLVAVVLPALLGRLGRR